MGVSICKKKSKWCETGSGAGLSEPKGPGRLPPIYFSDQLVLFKPGGIDYAQHITSCPPPPDFQTFLRPLGSGDLVATAGTALFKCVAYMSYPTLFISCNLSHLRIESSYIGVTLFLILFRRYSIFLLYTRVPNKTRPEYICINKNRVGTPVWKQSKKGCADGNFSPKLINVPAALFGTLE